MLLHPVFEYVSLDSLIDSTYDQANPCLSDILRISAIIPDGPGTFHDFISLIDLSVMQLHKSFTHTHTVCNVNIFSNTRWHLLN